MKKLQLKDSERKAKNGPFESNIAHSQSPPHKKLIKKLESIHSNNTNVKTDYSLQDRLVPAENTEETRDFRTEIEKRFNKSVVNKKYCFPLRRRDSQSSHSSASSERESFELLRYVTVYDLASQNKHSKQQNSSTKSKPSSSQLPRHENQHIQNFEPQSQATNVEKYYHQRQEVHETADSVPLEVQIQDKNSAAYKKLISILESNSIFSHNLAKSKQGKPTQIEPKQVVISTELPKNQIAENPNITESDRNIISPMSRNLKSQMKNLVGSVYHSKIDISSSSTHNNQRLKQRGFASELDSMLSKTNTSLQINNSNNRSLTAQNDQIIARVTKTLSNDTFIQENRGSGVNESHHNLRSESNLKKAVSYDRALETKLDASKALDESLGKSSSKRHFQSKM